MTLNVAVLLNAAGVDRSASKTATPTFQIAGDGGAATYRCAIDGVTIGDFRTSDAWGSVNVFVGAPIADGPHTFTFEELVPHPGGPPGYPCQPFPFSVDTRPPSPPTILSVTPSAQRPDGKWSLTVKGTIVAGEATVNVRVYSGYAGIGGAIVNGTTFTVTTTALASGTYTIEAAAVDPAGNISARSNGVTVTLGSPPQPTAPGAPVAGSGTAHVVTLVWTTPTDGGSPITGYVLTWSVQAENAVGDSPSSATVVTRV